MPLGIEQRMQKLFGVRANRASAYADSYTQPHVDTTSSDTRYKDLLSNASFSESVVLPTQDGNKLDSQYYIEEIGENYRSPKVFQTDCGIKRMMQDYPSSDISKSFLNGHSAAEIAMVKLAERVSSELIAIDYNVQRHSMLAFWSDHSESFTLTMCNDVSPDVIDDYTASKILLAIATIANNIPGVQAILKSDHRAGSYPVLEVKIMHAQEAIQTRDLILKSMHKKHMQ